MPRSSLLKHLHDLVAKDELKTALKVLRDFLEDSPLLKNAILLNRRLTAIDKEVAKGTVSFEDSTLTKNQITDGLLSLLTEIEELGANPDIRAEIDAHDNENLLIRFIDRRGAQRSERLRDIISKNLADDKQEIAQLTAKLNDLTQTLEKKGTVLDHLELQIFNLKTTLVEKNQQIEENEKRFEAMALEINGKDLSTFPRLYAEAYEYFIKGDVKKALKILDRQKMLDRMESRKKLREEEDKEAAKEWILRAELLQTEHRYDEVGECFEFAVKLNPNWDTYLDAADFFHFILHDFKIAENYYHLSRTHSKSELENAISASRSAMLYRHKKDFKQSKSFFEKAMGVLNSIDEKGNLDHLKTQFDLNNGLGNLYSELNKYQEGKRCYNEALRISEEIVNTGNDLFPGKVADVLINLGNILLNEKEYSKAESTFEKALAINQEVVFEKKEFGESQAATILQNLGYLKYKFGNIPGATKYYSKAILKFRELADINPRLYLYSLAVILSNYGVFCDKTNNIESASDLFNEALLLFLNLNDLHPTIYLEAIANTHNNIGTVQKKMLKFDEAEKSFQEAKKIQKMLISTQLREDLQPDLAKTLNGLGNLFRNIGRHEEAKKEYEDALRIFRDSSEKEPNAFMPYVALTLNNLGLLFLDIEKAAEAQNLLEEALEIYSKIERAEPRMVWNDLLNTMNNLGLAYFRQSELHSAKDMFMNILKRYSIIQNASDELNNSLLPKVALIENNLANVYSSLGDFSEAEGLYLESLAKREILAKERGGEHLINLCQSYFNLGIFFLELDKKRSKQYLVKAVNSLENLDTFTDNSEYYLQNAQVLLTELEDMETGD